VISSETQAPASTADFDFHTRPNRHVPDRAASHISKAEDPPPWDRHSAPASATAASAGAIPSVDKPGPAAAAAAAVTAGHYSPWQAVLLARDMGSQRDM
jgi:hypothetical protein